MKQYIEAFKPRIVLGNLLSFFCGLFFSSPEKVNFPSIITEICGLICVIASSCFFNNYFDKDIDQVMERTRQRLIIEKQSLIFFSSFFFLFFGFFLILCSSGSLVFFFSFLGFFFYVIIYTLILKRQTKYSTIFGSVSGSMPPVIGYCSLRSFDEKSIILFLIFIFWQIPHVIFISSLYYQDYQKANIPVLFIQKKKQSIKILFFSSVFLFSLLNIFIFLRNYAGCVYFFTSVVNNIMFFYISLYSVKNCFCLDKTLIKKSPLFSFLIIFIFILSIIFDTV